MFQESHPSFFSRAAICALSIWISDSIDAILSLMGSGRSLWFRSHSAVLSPAFLTILPGTPTTVQSSGTSLRTTDPAPMRTLFQMVMLPRTDALQPMTTWFPMVGCLFPLLNETPPRVTPW